MMPQSSAAANTKKGVEPVAPTGFGTDPRVEGNARHHGRRLQAYPGYCILLLLLVLLLVLGIALVLGIDGTHEKH